jgi:hypothetical protein
MAKTHFTLSGGSVYGAHLTQYQYPEALGNVFFVSHVSGTDSSGRGRTPDNPVASISYAVSLCTADNHDFIVVLPGHIETVGSAGALALSVAGISVVGAGKGRQRGKINWSTAATASVTVTAARCRIANMILTMTGFDAITAGISVSAADFVLEDCEVELASASAQATLGVLTTAAADRMRIERCHFHGTSDAGTAAAIRIVGGDSIVIKDNIFHGAYTTTLGAIDNATTATTGAQIQGNSINNLTAASAVAMTFQAGSTGQIRDNTMQVLTGTAPIVGAAMSWVGRNYYAATIATAGTLI